MWPKRKESRLRNYDYAQQGAYFVTICTSNNQELFGKVVDQQMQLNDTGLIVRDEWLRTSMVRSNVQLDEFIIMPDHMHGIILHDGKRATHRVAPTDGPKSGSIGAIVGQFKSITTKRIRSMGTHLVIWQRNYHEHIIRDEWDLNRIRQYILDNQKNGRTMICRQPGGAPAIIVRC